MGKESGIEYVDASIGFWRGCHKVSDGCTFCYAERDMTRFGLDHGTVVRAKDATFYAPLKWKEPKRILVCPWSDFFIEEADPWRKEAFVLMCALENHTFIIPTKRTERMRDCLAEAFELGLWKRIKPKNIWLLASIENQEAADKRLPELLALRNYYDWPVLGASIEPMLEAIDIRDALNGYPEREGSPENPGPWYQTCSPLDWVICGGESGPNARPMHPMRAVSLRDQCVEAGVPFFFKQWGNYAPCGRLRDSEALPVDDDRTIIVNIKGNLRGQAAGSLTNHLCEFSDGSHCEVMHRVGKKAAGRLLDGREWNQYPEQKARWYFTFGYGHVHPNKFVIIYGTHGSARAEMFRRYGKEWSMQYSEKQSRDFEKYGITELV